VEGDGHDAVGGVECLFNAITVVDVNVDVEDARVEAEEFEDAKNDVCLKSARMEFKLKDGMCLPLI
jgi:hypothetical protein